jgi:hypothetical protein
MSAPAGWWDGREPEAPAHTANRVTRRPAPRWARNLLQEWRFADRPRAGGGEANHEMTRKPLWESGLRHDAICVSVAHP